MDYYVFDTEGHAITAQSSDYSEYIASLPTEKPDGDGGFTPIDNTNYINVTTSWSSPVRQRATDDKYIYPVCPASTASGRTIEPLNDGGVWFPTEEA